MDREKIVERDFMGLINSDEIADKKEDDSVTKDSCTDAPVDDGSHNSLPNNDVPCQHLGTSPMAYPAGSMEGLSSSVHPVVEYGVFPSSNISLPMQNYGQHLSALAILKGQQAVSSACGASSMANPFPIQHSFFPDCAGVYPTTRATSKSATIPGNPAQLTIFYAGTVNVYDDVPADKAQGLMLLAASARLSKTINLPPRSSLMSMPMATGCHTPSIASPFTSSLPNQACNTTPQAPLQKPQENNQPNSSTAVSLNAGDSQKNQCIVTSIGQQEASISSAMVITPVPVVPRAVPQARKASLARFLEKRKERISIKAPYPTKKSPDASPQREQSPSSKHASSPLDECLTKNHQVASTGLEEKISFDSESIGSFQKDHSCLQKAPKIEGEDCEITV
uniref:GroupV JAZ protein n=1 Tax=Taxus chinensis TaxID=29808 RepID=A0A2P0JA47_TAXCH|nr:groupV JAZ protein [Taxus chinensis]